MIPKEILQKIRRIEITTSRLVTDVFAGQYHSVFKGQGIEFDEVREYQDGDDIRTIDRNVTARTGRLHVKKFVEERELTVMIMVDASRSASFGSTKEIKSQLAAEISALIALSAIRNNDKVGLIIFTDQVEKFIAPRKGRRHVLRVVREVLYYKPQRTGTNIPQALDYLNKTLPRRSIVFLISDFFQSGAPQIDSIEKLKKILSVSNKHHDLIAVTLNDPREMQIPDAGLLTLQDSETGEMVLIDSTDAAFRRHYAEENATRLSKRKQMFRSVGMDFIDIYTHQPYADEMVKFFMKRKHQRF